MSKSKYGNCKVCQKVFKQFEKYAPSDSLMVLRCGNCNKVMQKTIDENGELQ